MFGDINQGIQSRYHARTGPGADPCRRACPHQCAGHAPSEVLAGHRRTPDKQHRCVHDAQRPASGEPQRCRRRHHQRPGVGNRSRYAIVSSKRSTPQPMDPACAPRQGRTYGRCCNFETGRRQYRRARCLVFFIPSLRCDSKFPRSLNVVRAIYGISALIAFEHEMFVVASDSLQFPSLNYSPNTETCLQNLGSVQPSFHW
jgi:hypothetical protein